MFFLSDMLNKKIQMPKPGEALARTARRRSRRLPTISSPSGR